MAVFQDHNDILDRVIRLAAEQGGLRVSDVTADMKLGDDVGLDSLDYEELSMVIEDEFALCSPLVPSDTVRQIAEKVLAASQPAGRA